MHAPCELHDAKHASHIAGMYQPLVVVAAAVALGIVGDRLTAFPLALSASTCAGGLIAWFIAYRRNKVQLASLALCASCAGLGGAWHHVRWSLVAADELSGFAGVNAGPVCLRARAVGYPSLLPVRPFDPLRGMPEAPRSRLRLATEAVRDGEHWRKASGRPTLTVDGRLPAIEPGSRLQIVAHMARIAPPLNPGEFDYASHAKADGQLIKLWAESPNALTLIEAPAGWQPGRWLARLRRAAAETLTKRISPQRAGVASAILLGTRDQLEDLQSQSYFVTGMVHVLSISGLHVGILAAGLFWLLRLGLVPQRAALVAVALVTLGYAVLIGAEAPAVRATIIVLVACASLMAGRRALEMNSLAAAALVVLAMNPADLFRAGPQLSFLAAATLGWLSQHRRQNAGQSDPLQRLLDASHPWPVRLLRDLGRDIAPMLLVTVAVWGVTLPLVVWNFHIVSPAALLLTPLLALPFAISLFAGLLLVFFGWLLPPLAALAGFVCDQSLALGDALVRLASDWPAGHLWVAGPPAWWIAGFYVLVITWVVFHRLWSKPRGALLALAAWSLVGFVPPMLIHRPHELVATFLSVGHGCAAVVETPDGKTMLYDAGRLGSPRGAAQTIAGYLWWRGIARLDCMVVSHADVDHFNGIPELLERFSVGTLYLSASVLRDPPPTARLLISAAERAGTRVEALAAGDRVPLGERVDVGVLHPAADAKFESDNAASLVLLVESDGRRLLLPGDLEGRGLESLLEQQPREVDVLLAPHHGSPRSQPALLARWARPRWVIVSGSANDGGPVLNEAFAAEGAQVLHTSRSGAITVRSSTGALWVDCYRDGR